MDRKIILSKIKVIIEEVIDNGEIILSEETTANDIYGWDSLANIQIIHIIEHEYSIRFSSEEIASFRNIGEIIDHILLEK